MADMRDETLKQNEENRVSQDTLDKDEVAQAEVNDAGDAEGVRDDDESIPDEETLDTEEMTPEEKILTLEAELAQAKAKAGDYHNHLQRLQAEFDNYRRRTQREKEEFAKYASEKLIKELLPVLDNFERAIASSKTNQDFAAFAQGVEMILKQMQNLLSKEGLTPIEAVGQPFDPNIHEAIMQVDSDDYPENTVVEELLKGYCLKDKVIRPSMVKVSR